MKHWWKCERSRSAHRIAHRRPEAELLEKRIALGGLLRALLAACLGGDADGIEDITPPPKS